MKLFKNKSLIKDIFRTIKNSFGRFLAIVAMTGLSVMVFIGLQSGVPNLKQIVLDRFTSLKIHDLRVFSYTGIRDKDKDILNSLAGNNKIEYAFSEVLEVKNSDYSINLNSLTKDIDIYLPVKGRQPENPNEILLDSKHLDDFGDKIGQKISLVSKKNNKDEELLENYEFTIVGYGLAVDYSSNSRSGASSRDGNYFAAIMPELLNKEFPDYALARLEMNEGKDISTKEFKTFETSNIKRFRSLFEKRPEQVKQEIIAEAKVEISDAKEKLADGKNKIKDGEKKLADAKIELDDAKLELEDGKIKLEDSKNTLDTNRKKLEDSKKELDDGWKKMADAKKELDDGKKELADAKKKLDDGKKELVDNKKLLDDSKKTLDQGKLDLDKGALQLKDSQAKYLSEIQKAKNEIADGQKQLDQAKAELAQGQKEYQAGLEQANKAFAPVEEQLKQEKTKLDQAKAQLDKNKSLLDQGFAQYQAGLEAYNQAFAAYKASGLQNPATEQALASQKAQLDSTKLQLDQSKAQYDAGIAQYQAGLKLYEEGLAKFQAEKANTLKQLEVSKAKLDQGQKEINASQVKLDQAKSLLAKEEADGKAKLVQGQKDIDQARKKYEDGLAKYNTGKSKYDQGLNTIMANEAKYNKAIDDLAIGQKKYEDGITELKDGQKKYDDGLKKFKDGQEKYDQAVIDLKEGQDKYNKGLKDYEKGKLEFEEKTAEARLEIADAEKEISDIEDELQDLNIPLYRLEGIYNNIAFASYIDQANSLNLMSYIFTALFYSVAILVTLTTVLRMVETERTQLGVMKAIGYKSRLIMSKYLVYGVLAAFLGSILGTLVGYKVLMPPIIKAYVAASNLQTRTDILQMSKPLIIGLASIFIIGGTIFFTVNHSLNEVPASLMRPKPPKDAKRTLIERIPFIWNKLSFLNKVSIRNLFRSKIRMLMIIIGVSGSFGLIAMAFGIQTSIENVGPKQFGEVYKYDSQIIVDNKEDDFEDLMKEIDKVSEDKIGLIFEMASVDLKDGFSEDISLVATNKVDSILDFIELKARTSDKVYHLEDDKVIISEMLSINLGLKEGDVLNFKDAKGINRSLEIQGITEQYFNHVIYMTETTYWSTINKNQEINSYFIKFKDKESVETKDFTNKITDFKADLNYIPMTDLKGSLDELSKALGVIIMLIIAIAALLTFVVLYNLTNINISERFREIATIKVLGFRPGEVAAYIFKENYVLTGVGIVVGIFVAKAMHSIIVFNLSFSSFLFDPAMNPLSFVWAGLAVIFFMALVLILAKKEMDEINMVEALKAVD